MKKINRYLFTITIFVFAFFFINNKLINAEDTQEEKAKMVINANSNGEASGVYDVWIKNEETKEYDSILKKQFTRSRDISIHIEPSEYILNKYNSFIVCEVINDGDDKRVIAGGSSSCPVYYLSESIYNYQIKTANDGEKEIVVIFDYQNKTQWTQSDDLVVSKIYLDTTGPSITLVGGEFVYVPKNQTYLEQGATCDSGNISLDGGQCQVAIEEKVIQKNKEGFQYIRYTATDFLGNETNILRKVMVEVIVEDSGMDLYWYAAILIVFVVSGFLMIKVIKNKDKQKNQSVL